MNPIIQHEKDDKRIRSNNLIAHIHITPTETLDFYEKPMPCRISKCKTPARLVYRDLKAMPHFLGDILCNQHSKIVAPQKIPLRDTEVTVH